MIFVLGDVHEYFNLLSAMIKETKNFCDIDAIIQVGDFGVYDLDRVRTIQTYDVPLYFIEGNHENPLLLERLKNGREGVIEVSETVRYVTNGTKLELCGLTWFFYGGCSFFCPENSPAWSVIDYDELSKNVAAAGSVDVVVTHDGPRGLEIPGHPAFGDSLDCGSLALCRCYDLCPKYWFFGHHHQFIKKDLRGVFHNGLDMIQKGGLLFDQQGGQTGWRTNRVD